MSVLCFGLGIFLFAVILHIIIWRMRVPRRGISALLRIFCGVFFIAVILMLALSAVSPQFRSVTPAGFIEYLRLWLFFTSLALAYTITYSAIEADSPSVMMVAMIAASGREGLSESEFGRMTTDEVLIKPRIDDLLKDGLVYANGNRYILTRSGDLFVYPFIFYRRLLNLPKGG